MSPAESVFRELRALGVVLSINRDGRLICDAPEGVVSESVMARIRSHRDDLLGIVERIEERAGILEYDAGLDRREAERRALAEVINDSPEPMPPGVICPWCNGSRLVDALEGLRCWDCGRIAWVRRGRSIIRADCLKVGLDI
jgi:hypothetical protein